MRLPIQSITVSGGKVKLSTDGSCLRNPGPGGWAYVLRSDDHTREKYGCEPYTTNSRMELRAVIEGLKGLQERCAVTVRTDSQYVQKGVAEWLDRWKSSGWRKSTKQPVKNRDLWEELDTLT